MSEVRLRARGALGTGQQEQGTEGGTAGTVCLGQSATCQGVPSQFLVRANGSTPKPHVWVVLPAPFPLAARSHPCS